MVKFKIGEHIYHWALGRGEIIKITDNKYLCYFGGDTYEYLTDREILNDK